MKRIFTFLLLIMASLIELFLIRSGYIMFAVAATLKRGIVGTGTVTATRVVVDMSDPEDLEPDIGQLLLLLNKITGKRVVHNTNPKWQEDDYVPMHDTVRGTQAGIASPTDTTFDVTTGARFRIGDLIVLPETNAKVCNVLAVDTAANTISIATLDGTNLTTYTDLDNIEILSNYNEEGTGQRTILSTQPGEVSNYTQIIKSDTGETGSQSQVKVYGPEELDRNRKKLKVEHDLKIQKAMFFGEAKNDTSGTHPKRAMRGITNFITSKVTDQNNVVLVESDWEAFLESGFEYGSATKYIFCSSRVLSYPSAWARNKLQMLPKDKTYGIEIWQYVSPHGKVYLLNARKIFTRAPWNTWAVMLDLANIRYIVLGNRDTKLTTNVQANDEDQEIDEFLTECSVEVKFEETCSILKNVA